VVDGSGLENRHARKGIGGSNPSLSAIAFVIWHLQARDTYTDSALNRRCHLCPAGLDPFGEVYFFGLRVQGSPLLPRCSVSKWAGEARLGPRKRPARTPFRRRLLLRIGVKRAGGCASPSGKDPLDAAARRERKEAELSALNNGVSVLPEAGNEHPSVAAAVAKFLDETELTKKPKTLAAYTTALSYCTESCPETLPARHRSHRSAEVLRISA
jgi:hypothetical protein